MSMTLKTGEKVWLVHRPEGTYVYNKDAVIMVKPTSIEVEDRNGTMRELSEILDTLKAEETI